MNSFSDLVSYALYPIYVIENAHSQYYWPTYVGAALCAILFYAVLVRRKMRFSQMINIVFPAHLLQHESSKLDIKLMFLGMYYLLLQGILVSGFTWFTVDSMGSTLTSLFGASPLQVGPSYLVTALAMGMVFMAVELGYWFAHFMMHRIPWLWEFHKVHHSAEVLTPLTEWRQHPLELALFPILVGMAVCFVQGPIVWLFGPQSLIINPVTANLISMAFWYTILHLRHSQLPFYATGLLGKIIQAPAHHQVHHSTNPAHYDKNLGYCLSVWDWVFGTLYLPKRGEKFTFGLGHQDSALETALGSILAPISRAGTLIWRKIVPPKTKQI